ncbi:unnamed protein product [Ectocarpus sp. 6 AP-2014]
MAKRRRAAETSPVLEGASGTGTPQPAAAATAAAAADTTMLALDHTTDLQQAADRLTLAASRPEDFFQANETIAEELTSVLRSLFSIARKCEAQRKPFGPLEELHVQGLDSESIWSELELRNVPLEKHTKKTLARLLQSEDMSLAADIASDEEAEGREEASDGEEADDGDADMEGGDSTALLLGGGSVSDGDDDAKGEVDGEDGSDADGDENTSAFKARGKGDKATGTTKSSKQAKNQKTEDMFFDADDMEKFADEGTMDDDDLEDGVLDEMYGGGGGDADSGEEKDQEDDSDEEDDAEMMEELMQEEAESEDEQVGGGIKHEDFFDDGDDGDKPRSKRKLSKKKQSSRRQQEEEEEEEEGGAESDGEDVDDGEDGDASNDEGDEEEEEEEETGVLSAHVQHSRRMKSKISDQERELLAEKPWALRGEVHSHDRPQNSLLEATVDVERATRVAPPPTAEHAMTLLDMGPPRTYGSEGGSSPIAGQEQGRPWRAVRERVLEENHGCDGGRPSEGPQERTEASLLQAVREAGRSVQLPLHTEGCHPRDEGPGRRGRHCHGGGVAFVCRRRGGPGARRTLQEKAGPRSRVLGRWGRDEPGGSKTVTFVEEGRQAESQATGGSGPEAGVQAQSGSREQVREGQDDEGHPGCQERHHRHRGRGINWTGIQHFCEVLQSASGIRDSERQVDREGHGRRCQGHKQESSSTEAMSQLNNRATCLGQSCVALGG